MDFILPIIGVYVGTAIGCVVLIPLFSLVYFDFKHKERKHVMEKYFLGVAVTAVSVHVFNWALFWIWCCWVDYSMHDPQHGKVIATDFAPKFQKIEGRLYKATSAKDPAFVEFKQLLNKYGKLEKVQIGPYHDGRREMAISYDRDVPIANGIMYGIILANDEHWYVGSPADTSIRTTPDGVSYPGPAQTLQHEDRMSANNSDFKFALRRNGSKIDVLLFTKVYVDLEHNWPIDTILRGQLGDFYFQRYLGKVLICPTRLEATKKARPLKLVQMGFRELMTKDELADVDAEFTNLPCVSRYVRLAKEEANYDANNFAHEQSKFFLYGYSMDVVETRTPSEIDTGPEAKREHRTKIRPEDITGLIERVAGKKKGSK